MPVRRLGDRHPATQPTPTEAVHVLTDVREVAPLPTLADIDARLERIGERLAVVREADALLARLLRFDGLDPLERRWAEDLFGGELAQARRGLRRHEPTAVERVEMLAVAIDRARAAAAHEREVMASAQARHRDPFSGCSVGG